LLKSDFGGGNIEPEGAAVDPEGIADFDDGARKNSLVAFENEGFAQPADTQDLYMAGEGYNDIDNFHDVGDFNDLGGDLGGDIGGNYGGDGLGKDLGGDAQQPEYANELEGLDPSPSMPTTGTSTKETADGEC